MILVHRITPFLIGIVIAGSLALTSLHPTLSVGVIPAAYVAVFVLLARLTNFRFNAKETWVMVGTPMLFLLSAVMLFLFLDTQVARIAISVTVALLSYFYAEQLFMFVHLPATYQPYALQNLTGILGVLSLFFFVAGSHALLLFERVPLVVLAVFFFPITFAIIFKSLWTANVPHDVSRLYALGGAVLFTELFASVSYLPTTFLTNAAILAILFYLFLGISRAQSLAKLSRPLLSRYLSVGAVMLVAVIVTAQWV